MAEFMPVILTIAIYLLLCGLAIFDRMMQERRFRNALSADRRRWWRFGRD